MYKVIYFRNCKGRCQHIKYLLKDNEIPYEVEKIDTLKPEWIERVKNEFSSRVDWRETGFAEDWREKGADNFISEAWQKIRSGEQPLGMLPVMICPDGQVIPESYAIMRHLARKYGLYGTCEQEMTVIDVLSDREAFVKDRLINATYDVEWVTGGRARTTQEIAGRLKQLEDYITRDATAMKIITGDKMTFVHYSLFDSLDNFLILKSDILEGVPILQSLHKRMAARPKIAEEQASEEFINSDLGINWALKLH